MGCFNEIVALVMKASNTTSKDLREGLRADRGPRIDESTVSRWKRNSLPRPYIVSSLIEALAQISSREIRLPETLTALKDEIAESVAAGSPKLKALFHETDAGDFVRKILSASYSIQRDEAEAERDGFVAGRFGKDPRRWLLFAVVAIVAAGIAAGAFALVQQRAEFRSEWKYLHPVGYAGPVWIRLEPRPGESSVSHTCRIEWGNWAFADSFDFKDGSPVFLRHLKEDPKDSVEIRFTVYPPCRVRFGQGEPKGGRVMDIDAIQTSRAGQ
jgi:hypothetical protein